MIRSDFHMHTNYCDGKNSPEEMVLAAIDAGFTAIGFSGHAYAEIPGDPGMSAENTGLYITEIARLKEKYADRIHIYCGIEWDIYSGGSREGFEYVIGSVHYMEPRPEACVDNTPEILSRYVEENCGGDYILAAERYFDNVCGVVEDTGADVIGHFDLITKFNEGDRLFDTHDERYVRAWQRAADQLLLTGKPFEINTGAMARGFRSGPYPAADIIDYIGEAGGSFLLSSDSHSALTLGYAFLDVEKYLRERGYPIVNI